MADFKKRGNFGDRSGGSRSFGDRPSHGGGFRGGSSHGFGGGASGGFGGGRSRFGRPGNKEFRQTQMFSAVCASCQKPCEVPFKPNGEKPVYCNYCFGKNKSGGASDSPKRDFSSSTNTSYPKKDFSALPLSVAKPAVDAGHISEIKKQLEVMNTKIDKLMEIMGKKEEEYPVKKVVAKKVAIKTATKVAKKK